MVEVFELPVRRSRGDRMPRDGVRARAGDVIRVLLRHQLRGRLNPEWEVGVREGPALCTDRTNTSLQKNEL